MRAVLVFLIFVAVVVFFLGRSLSGIAGRESHTAPRYSLRRFFLIAGVSLALIRVGSLWILVHQNWTGRESLDLLPLVLLLFPEGLLLPKGFAWTFWAAVSFSGLLAIGSFLWAGTASAAMSVIVRLRGA